MNRLPRNYPERSVLPVVYLAVGTLLAAIGFGWLMNTPEPAAHLAAADVAK